MAIKISPNRKVNPNPRPPNEPRVSNNKKISGAQPGAVRGGVRNVGQPKGKTVGSIGSSPAVSSAPAAVSSAPTLAAGQPDPRDATYWETLSGLEFTKNKELENLSTQGVFDSTSHEREKNQLAYQAPIEQRHLKENANVAGAIYSTATQEDLGNLATEQTYKSSSLEEAYNHLLFERAMQKEGIGNEFNLKSGEAFKDAVGRAVQKASEEEGEEPVENFGGGGGGGGGSAPRTNTAKGSAFATKKKPIAAKAFGQALQNKASGGGNKKKK